METGLVTLLLLTVTLCYAASAVTMPARNEPAARTARRFSEMTRSGKQSTTSTGNAPIPPTEPGPPDRSPLFAILATGVVLAVFTRFSAEEVIALLGALGALYRTYHHR